MHLHQSLKQHERLKKKIAEFRKNAENFHAWYSMSMCLLGFSVTEENACLMLCIAVGEKCPKVPGNFFIAVDKNCLKISDNFLNCF